MSRKILALSAVVTILVALFALTGATFAARTSSSVGAASSPPLNFPAMQKHCAVLDVHLNGTPHPGVSCLHRQMPAKQTGVHHYTYTGACNGSQTMDIVYNSWNSEICFYGTGYLPLATLTNVVEVAVYISTGWFKEYNPSGGHYCTLGDTYIDIFESVAITQVDPGATNPNAGVCG